MDKIEEWGQIDAVVRDENRRVELLSKGLFRDAAEDWFAQRQAIKALPVAVAQVPTEGEKE